MKLSESEELARRLVGATLCDIRTARKYLAGEPLRKSVHEALAEAERRLRLESEG